MRKAVLTVGMVAFIGLIGLAHGQAETLPPAQSSRDAVTYAYRLGVEATAPKDHGFRLKSVLREKPFFASGGVGPAPTGPDLNRFQKADAMAMAEVWVLAAQAADISPVELGIIDAATGSPIRVNREYKALSDFAESGVYPPPR